MTRTAAKPPVCSTGERRGVPEGRQNHPPRRAEQQVARFVFSASILGNGGRAQTGLIGSIADGTIT